MSYYSFDSNIFSMSLKWDGENYSRNSALQEHFADSFMNSPNFPTLHPCKEGSSVIIDIGCGDGRITKKIYDIVGGKVYGIDVSPEQIAHAIAHHTVIQEVNRLQYFVVDATELDSLPLRYPNQISAIHNTVDRVVSFNCLHWVQDHVKLFEQIYKALKKGGRVDILYGWSSNHHEEAIEKLQKMPQFAKELGDNVNTDNWFDQNFKNKFLKSLLPENEADKTYSFGVDDEGTKKLIQVYRKFLGDIGFRVEHFDVFKHTLPIESAYKTREDLEGHVFQWFPLKSRFDTIERQKEIVSAYIDLMKDQYEIKDENGNVIGYMNSFNAAHVHLVKPYY